MVPKSLTQQALECDDDNDVEPRYVTRCIGYLGAPMCQGQSNEGMDLAPKAVREAGICDVVKLLGWEFEDFGDLPIGSADLKGSSETPEAHESQYYDVSLIHNCEAVGNGCKQIFEAVERIARKRKFVLTVGGDHSIACGTISGLLPVYPDLAVVWVDAHGDCNTPETSPSGHYHGMPAAHVMGWFDKKARGFDFRWVKTHENDREMECKERRELVVPDNRFAFIGLRDIDKLEKRMMRRSKIGKFTMRDIDDIGIGEVMRRVLKQIDPHSNRPIHLSFDIDACDPAVAPGTGTLARGGLTYREAHYICETLAETGRLVSMDLVEISPVLEKLRHGMTESVHGLKMHGDQLPIHGDAGTTLALGLGLVASALGHKIL